jgi:hypothetical protein
MFQKDSLQLIRSNTRGRGSTLTVPTLTKRGKLRRYLESVRAAVIGTSGATFHRDTLAAYGLVTVASDSTGTLRTTINGVNVDVTSGEEEVADAALIVAAINASTTALVQYVVEADQRNASVALTSCAVGTYFDICGVRFTAVAKAASRLNQFEVSGSDTADGDALAAAINAHPELQDIVVAANSSGTVTIYSRRASTSTLSLRASGSGEVVVDFAATAVVCVSAIRKGLPGNWVTLAVTGTGITAGAARLAGGTTTVETCP